MNTKHLNNSPYLQVALDTPDINHVLKIVESLPDSDNIILEAGTPLIKRYGIDIIRHIRGITPQNKFIVADMKTLDTGALEVQIAADSTADAIVVSGLAPDQTINNVISEARNRGIYSIIDTLNVHNPLVMLKRLKTFPDIMEIHRAIDAEVDLHRWGIIPGIKALSDDILVAVAGGVQIDNIDNALAFGADILVVGRAITGSDDVSGVTKEFLDQL